MPEQDPLQQILAALEGINTRLDKLEAAQPSDEDEVDPVTWWAAHGRIIGPDGLTDAEREGHIRAQQITTDANENVFELHPPSEEKQAQRRMFADQQLRLNTVLPADPDVEDWNEVYVKGGPWWLYNSARDIVMTYPDNARRIMVADLEEDVPELAYQMSLDVLKQASEPPDLENGAGALAVGWVGGKPRG